MSRKTASTELEIPVDAEKEIVLHWKSKMRFLLSAKY